MGKILELLNSRKFLALVVATIVVFLQSFYPNFVLDETAFIGFALIIAATITGLVVDPGDMSAKWKSFLTSEKFWVAFVGIAVLVLRGFAIPLPFELTDGQLISLCLSFGAYIASVAFSNRASMRA